MFFCFRFYRVRYIKNTITHIQIEIKRCDKIYIYILFVFFPRFMIFLVNLIVCFSINTLYTTCSFCQMSSYPDLLFHQPELIVCWHAATSSEKVFKKQYNSFKIKKMNVPIIWYIGFFFIFSNVSDIFYFCTH